MLMLVILIGVMLGALLVPLIVSQNRSTRFDTTRVDALQAAQAGIDNVLGQIRADKIGDSGLLPCALTASGNPIVGEVNPGGAAQYSVYLDYYTGGTATKPTGLMSICVPGHGPFDGVNTVTPTFAVLTSTGTDGTTGNGATSGRTLTTTYTFQTSNANISGGTIRVYPASHVNLAGDLVNDETTNWCLDVGSATPAAGTVVGLQQCSTTVPLAPQQKFGYRHDLTLQLISSVGSVVNGVTYTNGLCIDVQNRNTFGTAPLSGTSIVLAQCAQVDSPVWSQQWSIDRYRSIQASTSTSANPPGTLANLCMTVDLVTTGPYPVHGPDAAVSVRTCDQSLTSASDGWIPSPAIGAGAAVDPDSDQWINFDQFGRCLDVPNNDTTPLYITAPGCRQNPYGSAPEYVNQLFVYNTAAYPKTMSITFGGISYCLYSQDKLAPTYPDDTDVLDHRVLLTPCAGHTTTTTIKAAALQWTRTTPTTDPALPFSSQFRLVDNVGQCMSLANVIVPGDTHDYDVWQKAVTVTCDLSPVQQWNASTNPSGTSIGNTTEK